MKTEALTRTEESIVKYIAVDNLTAKETAEKLCVVYQCVKGHLQTIYDKLGIKRNLQALTKWYYTMGSKQIISALLLCIFSVEIANLDMDGRLLRTRGRRRGKDEIEFVDFEEFI